VKKPVETVCVLEGLKISGTVSPGGFDSLPDYFDEKLVRMKELLVRFWESLRMPRLLSSCQRKSVLY
jgi:hypothetical protein